MLCGARIRILPDDLVRDPQRLFREIERSKITVWETVPSLLLAGLDGPIVPLSSLRWLLATGEAVTPELCRMWFSRYPSIPLMNAYGPAESSDDVAVHAVTGPLPEGALMCRSAIDLHRLYGLTGREPVPVGGGEFISAESASQRVSNDPVKTASPSCPIRSQPNRVFVYTAAAIWRDFAPTGHSSF